MELGNSRGAVHVPRGAKYEEELTRLFYAIDPHHDGYGLEFENEVFSLFPYYWGDCTCGYEETEWAWCEANKHSPDCYQSEVDRRVKAFAAEIGYSDEFPAMNSTVEEVEPGVVLIESSPRQSPNRELGRQVREYEDSTRKELCEKYGLTYPNRCAVHCTCDYETRWAEFAASNGHAETCPIVRPNFHYRPTDLRLEWYKYPLRDSYFNRECGLAEFRSIITKCIESL